MNQFVRDKSTDLGFMPSVDSDHPDHPHSLQPSLCAYYAWVAKDVGFLMRTVKS